MVFLTELNICQQQSGGMIVLSGGQPDPERTNKKPKFSEWLSGLLNKYNWNMNKQKVDARRQVVRTGQSSDFIHENL